MSSKEGELIDEEVEKYRRKAAVARELGRFIGASQAEPEQVALAFALFHDSYLEAIFLHAAKAAVLERKEEEAKRDKKQIERGIAKFKKSLEKAIVKPSEELVVFDNGLIRRTLLMKARLRVAEKKVEKMNLIDRNDPLADYEGIIDALEESNRILNELTATERATGSHQMKKFARQLRSKMRKIETALGGEGKSETDKKFTAALEKLSQNHSSGVQ